MNNIKMIAAAAALSIGMASPAWAQMVEARNVGSVEAALKKAGYPVKTDKDSSGDPRIITESGGIHLMISFYGCKSGKDCTTVSLVTAFSAKNKPTLDAVNKWNSTKRFGRVFLDGEGDPVVQFEIDLDDGGMSQDLFIDNIEWFAAASTTVKQELAN